MNVMKWLLMSSVIVPLMMLSVLQLVSMWSIRDELPLCMRVVLKLVR